MSLYSILSKLPVVRFFLYKFAVIRVAEKIESIRPYLGKTDKIVDIGSGNSILASSLVEKGYNITALDVVSTSFISSITPVIYDGVHMPFKNKAFDVSLLITVLHHAPVPEVVLTEAKRVSKRIIIIEEIYNNLLTKHITFAIDSLFNLEFFGHPHTNKTDREWKKTFKKLGLTLETSSYSTSLGLLKRALYVVS